MKYGFEDWYCLLAESYVDKQVNKAARYIENNHARLIGLENTAKGNPKTAKDLANDVRHMMPVLDSKNSGAQKPGKFIVGAARIFYDEFDGTNHRDVSAELSRTIQTLIRDGHENQYDENLNGMTFDQLENEFSRSKAEHDEKSRNELASRKWVRNPDYTIVRINSTEEAAKYRKYLNPGNPWCITQEQSLYNNYTNGGVGLFYFVMKRGFENIPAENGPNSPHDEYGESMFAVSVDENGRMLTCTSRWNGSGDFFTPEEISERIGMNFYEAFPPPSFDEVVKRMDLSPVPDEWEIPKTLGYMLSNAMSRQVYGGWFTVVKPDYEKKTFETAEYHPAKRGSDVMYSRKTGRFASLKPIECIEGGILPNYFDERPTPIYIDAGVKSVDLSLFEERNITKIEIDPNNRHLKMVGGCLYQSNDVNLGNDSGQTPDWSKSCLVWHSPDMEELDVEEGTTSILYASHSKVLRKVHLPEGLVEIGVEAFSGCTNLKEINFPKSLAKIYGRAFIGTGIESVELEPSCTVGINAFMQSSVKNVKCALNVHSKGAFSFCPMLKNVELLPGTDCIPESCFMKSDIKDSLKIPEGVERIEMSAFQKTNLTANGGNLVLPKSVKYVANLAFAELNANSVEFHPDSCVNFSEQDSPFGANTFSRSRIQQVIFPKMVSPCIIPDEMFESCKDLEFVKLPNNVQRIGKNAFRLCSSLTSILLPAIVGIVDNGAFCYCSNLRTINIPRRLINIQPGAFNGCESLRIVYVQRERPGQAIQVPNAREIQFLDYTDESELPFYTAPSVPQEPNGQPAMESFSRFLTKKRRLTAF